MEDPSPLYFVTKAGTSRGGTKDPCLPQTLAAKRCLAFTHCELEALHYYGTPMDNTTQEQGNQKITKALCASYDEGYCFGNPSLMKVDSDKPQGKNAQIFLHHQKAKRRIVNSRPKFQACQSISNRLHQCLREKLG